MGGDEFTLANAAATVNSFAKKAQRPPFAKFHKASHFPSRDPFTDFEHDRIATPARTNSGGAIQEKSRKPVGISDHAAILADTAALLPTAWPATPSKVLALESDVMPTPAELTLLGLLAEKPRYGYDLNAVIEERGIRNWTSLGLSSVYYLLHRLQERGLVETPDSDVRSKGRRVYQLTKEGRKLCVASVKEALETVTPVHSPVLVGWANQALLPRRQVVDALQVRASVLRAQLVGLDAAQSAGAPATVTVNGLFDHGRRLIEAELDWIAAQLETLSGGHSTI